MIGTESEFDSESGIFHLEYLAMTKPFLWMLNHGIGRRHDRTSCQVSPFSRAVPPSFQNLGAKWRESGNSITIMITLLAVTHLISSRIESKERTNERVGWHETNFRPSPQWRWAREHFFIDSFDQISISLIGKHEQQQPPSFSIGRYSPLLMSLARLCFWCFEGIEMKKNTKIQN